MMSDDSNNQSLARLTIDQSTVPTAVDPIESAIVLWAEASTRTETRDRDERLRDKRQIIRSFLNYVGKHPGEIDPMDVRAWRKYLEPEKSENTVYSYLSLVSSFYEWLRKHPEIKDHIRGNPVSLGRPKSPRPYQTEKTKAWTDGEMNAILDAIADEAAKGSNHALRDYAVTLFYLYSGLRRNEVFGLRGGDIELLEGGLIVGYKRQIQTEGREDPEKGSRPGGRARRAPGLPEKIEEALDPAYKRPDLDPPRSRRQAGRATDIAVLRQQYEKLQHLI